MDNTYEQFVAQLRKKMVAATGCREEAVCFRSGNHAAEEDRLYVEMKRTGKMRQVCALHTRDLFECYTEGVSIDCMVRDAVRGIHLLERDDDPSQMFDLDHYDAVKDLLFIRIQNLDRNRKELENVVYRQIGDIALVLNLKVGETRDCITSLKISKPILTSWGVNVNDVFEKALLNTYFMSPPRFYHWEEMLFDPEYEGENFMNLIGDFHISDDTVGNCLSTTLRTHGAVAIFLPGVARRIANILDSDFYIVFTSIHEAMIHRDHVMPISELKQILRDTVQEATPESDFLSFKIYHYDRETECFTWE